MSNTKIWFFEKINKIDKPFTMLTQITKTRNENS
jgi:hypothetical protein